LLRLKTAAAEPQLALATDPPAFATRGPSHEQTSDAHQSERQNSSERHGEPGLGGERRVSQGVQSPVVGEVGGAESVHDRLVGERLRRGRIPVDALQSLDLRLSASVP
jgi:hypothetical protein